MDIVYDILVFLHLLGMAVLVGGVIMRLAAPQSPNGLVLLSGAGAQVLTGVAITGIASSGLVDNDVNNTKIAVKLGIAVVVLVLAHILWRKPQAGKGLFYTLAALTLINVGVAVFW
ncbi:hypothetical protein SAXI111661_16665 [Saccharomonospora xinjiangensis]|uniref:hypothetical protein n=1 Tax=Saccharomonospora xinjiangensis TaxID=75294 RepID=UPI00106FD760|nr:hypothetical protein [Saccharomonospora xinjiangensis]QBQ62454.1 hypothetical protein EYD13_20625 [Saccharomonospora xinjiangensis]